MPEKEEKKETKDCCPDCKQIHDVDFEEVCGNTDCPCHNTLGVVAGEETKAQDKFGRL